MNDKENLFVHSKEIEEQHEQNMKTRNKKSNGSEQSEQNHKQAEKDDYQTFLRLFASFLHFIGLHDVVKKIYSPLTVN